LAVSSSTLSQWFDEGVTHHRAQRLDEAEALYRKILAADDSYADAHHLLGVVAMQRGNLDAASNRISEALRLNPRDERYYLNLANVLRLQHRGEEALAALGKAVEINPDYAEAWLNQALLQIQAQNADAALASLDRVVALKPDMAVAHFNRGNVQHALGRTAEAQASYERAVALQPNHADALYNLGVILQARHRWTEALTCYERAVGVNPKHALAHNNRAAVLTQLQRWQEALASYDAALAANPDYAEAYNNRGHVQAELKQYEAAIVSYQTALRLKPDFDLLPGVLLNAKMQICDWAGLDDAIDGVLGGIDDGLAVTTPFALLPLPASRAQQRRCAELHVQAKVAPSAPPPAATPSADGKIRVGYISPDFRTHPVSFLLAGLIEQHDRAKFEVIGLSYGTAPEADPMYKRMAAAFDQFIDIRALSDEEVVTKARALGLDIAVDLAGYTQHARSDIFAGRAAPVQINYLGLPATMGADFIDYIIGDAVVTPEAHWGDYAEKIISLPDTFQVNDSKRAVPGPMTRAQAGLPDDAFVFCSFSNTFKYNPDLFDVWVKILQRVPNSVLWLLAEDETHKTHLKNFMHGDGIDEARLIFAPRLSYDQHMARYQVADLILDTLPFNGGTTTADALWAGVPVLTCLGRTYAGRMAASVLQAAGLTDLVTTSLDDYAAKAVALAGNAAKLAQYRAHLKPRSSALFDTARFARHLESAYTQVVGRARAGQAPEHLVVGQV
jgi:predicted O-linked N-acetylglucosamine transferase (SPINDLY family)